MIRHMNLLLTSPLACVWSAVHVAVVCYEYRAWSSGSEKKAPLQ